METALPNSRLIPGTKKSDFQQGARATKEENLLFFVLFFLPLLTFGQAQAVINPNELNMPQHRL